MTHPTQSDYRAGSYVDPKTGKLHALESNGRWVQVPNLSLSNPNLRQTWSMGIPGQPGYVERSLPVTASQEECDRALAEVQEEGCLSINGIQHGDRVAVKSNKPLDEQ